MSATATKKSKKEATPPPTPEQQAEMYAKRMLEIRAEIEVLDAELKEAELHLKKWAEVNELTELFGLFKVVERTNPAKLVGATGKLLEMHTEKLLTELDGLYIQESKSLDIKRMFAAIGSDATLAALLKVKGLSLTQETSTSLRKI